MKFLSKFVKKSYRFIKYFVLFVFYFLAKVLSYFVFYFYYLLSYKKRIIVRKNLFLAFKEDLANNFITAKDLNMYERKFFYFKIQNFIDLWFGIFMGIDFLLSRIDIYGLGNLEKANKAPKGVVLMLPRISLWLFLPAIASYKLKKEIYIVDYILPKFLTKWFLVRFLKKENVGVLNIKLFFNKIVRLLSKNEIVGYVMDGFTYPPYGEKVPFFGVNTYTDITLAKLVKKLDINVVPLYIKKVGFLKWELHIYPPVLAKDFKKDNKNFIYNYVSRLNSVLEEFIKDAPYQWLLWDSNRWKV